MDWIKIPIDSVLYSEFKDSELIALIKYQALYCQLETKPTELQLKRIFTSKQLKFIQNYSEIVQELCENQVKNVITKRNKDKENYKKKQCVEKNSASGKLSERAIVSEADKIRLDKIRLDKSKKENYIQKKKSIPEDWKPKQETIDKLRARNLIVDLVVEKFVNACLANNYKYVDFDRAILAWNWEKDKGVQQNLNCNDEGVPY